MGVDFAAAAGIAAVAETAVAVEIAAAVETAVVVDIAAVETVGADGIAPAEKKAGPPAARAARYYNMNVRPAAHSRAERSYLCYFDTNMPTAL